MPDQRYEAQRQTIGVLLSTTSPRIQVPDWQRSYSWTSKEVETFWQDLINFDSTYPDRNIENEEYFLGSAVLVTGGSTHLLLDGQQRLATATILLSVLRDARRLYRADAATRLQNKYILDFDDATGETTPVLTLNVYDREFFRREIQEESSQEVVRTKPILKSHGLIRKARDFFIEKVNAEQALAGLGKPGFDRNMRLQDVLCNHMSLVIVSSTDEDNAAAVFETLNDRGIGLSTIDLLRNLLLRRANSEDERERIVTAWQVILEIADEANVEDFLRHYWVSQRGDVKARKLYREIKHTIVDEGIDSLEFSQNLADAAPLYRDLVRAQSSDAELRRQLETIRELKAKVLYPALLSAYSLDMSDSSMASIRDFTSSLITLFVRHSVVSGRESTALESVIYTVASKLRETGDYNEGMAQLFNFAPKADEFLAQFRRMSAKTIATGRYLLREIEHAKRKTQELSVDASDRVHVEHIYPKIPAFEKWPNHAQMINRLGNLTLLSKQLNTSIKNVDFRAKKIKGYANSDLLLTQELLDYEDWNPEAIEQRQAELANWAFGIWKFPDEPAPETDGKASTSVSPSGSEISQALEDLPEVPE